MKYKVGDRVKIKSLDWYNENKDKDGVVHCGDTGFDNYMSVFCGSVVTIGWVYPYNRYDIREDMHYRTWTDEMIEGLAEEENNHLTETVVDAVRESNDRYRIVLDPRFDIEVDEGEYYAVRRKKEYPKTYEECCKVLGYDDRETYCIFHTGADERLFEALYRLKVCRDAYWKIAGEEMGLGKPWKPDWKNEKGWIHCITNDCGEICCTGFRGGNKILAFPTEEMRDAFYENFDPDIEFCKELL